MRGSCKLSRLEMWMLRWTYGWTMLDRIQNEVFWEELVDLANMSCGVKFESGSKLNGLRMTDPNPTRLINGSKIPTVTRPT